MLDLDTIVARVSESIVAADAVDPIAVRFLLTQYAATGRDDLSAIVGEALARGLQEVDVSSTADRPDWLLLFVDAAVWSEDERVREAAHAVLGTIDRHAADGIEAALHASAAVGDGARLAMAVDDLERVVASGYEPGEGVAAVDQFALASALLTAFDITGRLPYAMLAEELVQAARRRAEEPEEIEGGCRAARVLCRLAALHADDEYCHAAVVVRDADYRGDARDLLTRHAARALEVPRTAALYGLALAHWLGLN